MDRVTKTLDEYFANIQANYKAIDGLILKRGKANTEETIARLEEQRRTAKDPEERAIYSYLLARACYWQGFHQFRATRNPDVFSDLRQKVFAEFLAAFKHIGAAEGAQPVTDQIRRDVIGGFGSVLATNLWGANLSVEEKQRAVAEFVNVVEKMPDREQILPSGAALTRMYRNLGIGERLDDIIPAELPEDCEDLWALVKENRKVVSAEKLLPVVEALERDHMEQLEEKPERLQIIADIYCSNGRCDKAFRLFSLAATKKSKYYFQLYDLSFREELDVPAARREEYLNKYIAGGAKALPFDPAKPLPDYIRAEAYDRAIRCLSHADRYRECLDLIARYDDDRSFQRDIKQAVNILLTKARCLDKLGEKPAALAAYNVFMEKSVPFDGLYVRSREQVEQRVRELAQE